MSFSKSQINMKILLTRPDRFSRAALLTLWLMLNAVPAYAQTGEGPDLSVARGLLTMPAREAAEEIKKFSAKEAEILNTQILALVRESNPDVDRVYALVRHLESLRADAQAQNRLNTLLYVLGLTLVLFTAFLIFVIVDQRRSLIGMQKLLADTTAKSELSGASDSSTGVYRGE